MDVCVATTKEKPVCFFFPLLFTAFVGWHLEFFTSGLCWGWQGQNQSGWEGLLGRGAARRHFSLYQTWGPGPPLLQIALTPWLPEPAAATVAAGALGDGPPSPSHPCVHRPTPRALMLANTGLACLGRSLSGSRQGAPACPRVPFWVSISSP